MKIFNNTTKTILTTSIIPLGAYIAATLPDKCSRLAEQNDSLRTELFYKELKNDSLQHDIVELKRQKTELEFNNELDSINKYSSKNLGTDFYERVINNAAYLDNYEYPYTHMNKVMYNIPDEELLKIHDDVEERWEASANVREFFQLEPYEL